MVISKVVWIGALVWGLALALCLALASPARAVDPPDTIGLLRPDSPTGTNTFFLRNANSLGPPANTIAGFGANGDEAVVGDWNGDGITTIGVFRPNSPAGTNTFFLRNINSLGLPDITIEGIGAAGDIPIVGDWDGNGTTTIGLFRPNSPPGLNTFLLWNSNTLGPPDITIEGIGVVGDVPIVGDWDANGSTTIGLFRSGDPTVDTNTFYLWNTNAWGAPDITVAGFGAIGDVPIAADWDADGFTTIGLFRSNEPTGSNTFYLRNTNVLGAPDVTIAGFGAVGDLPVAGHFGNNPPVVNPATFSIPENSPNGTPVGTVTFTDPDNPGQTHTFDIIGGNTGTAFAIDINTGQVTVANSAAVDFETNHPFSLTVRVTDNGTPVFSGEATITVNLTNVNEVPVVTTSGGVTAFTEDGGAVVVDGAVTVTDADGGNLASATVTITNLLDAGQETLAAPTLLNGAGANYLAPTLTITGAATVAQYQTMLQAVTYNNASQNPATTNRTIAFAVNDGTVDSAASNKTVSVTAVNDAPVGVIDRAHDVTGNVRIQVTAGSGDPKNLLNGVTDPEGHGLVPQVDGTSLHSGTIVINADGTYTYNPKAGRTGGADVVKYKVCDDGAPSACSAVKNLTLNIAGMIWFIDNNAAAGDGRLTNPFNTIVAFTGINDGGADHPAAGQTIFIHRNSATDYTGPLTLLNNQKVLGKGGTVGLATFAGITLAPDSDALPLTGGTAPIITTSSGGANGVTLAQGNSLRGFTIGNTAGAKIFGNFGTLTVGDTTSPDMTLNGTGKALDLTNGTFAATSKFISVTTTSSGTQGISLNNVAGTVDLGSTTVSNSTTAGISVIGSTATINFGNTSVTGGTEGIRLENNASGTRTFGTLSITNNSSTGFVHTNNAAANGGGLTSVTGTTTVTNPGGIGILIEKASASNGVTFANVNVTGSGGTGVRLGGTALGNAGTVAFADLDITPDANQRGFHATENTATITTTSGTIGTTGANAVEVVGVSTVSRTPLAMALTSVSSTGGTNNVLATNASGTLNLGIGALSGATGAAIGVSGSTAAVTYTGTVNNTAGGISLTNNTTGTINLTGVLTLSTGANAAFTATGGGTVNVTAATNTITTTTGTAVNVANTTIGASGITFQSISHNGNNTAIILNTTGAGAFSITGTGTTAGSGGTIENIVGADAITLNTTGGLVTLKNMIIEDITAATDAAAAQNTRSGVDAISGLNVNAGLTLDNVTIRRISDNAILGGTNGVPDVATVWNGLTINNSTIEDTNRFGVASKGDDNSEGTVRILGIRGIVNITNSVFQRGAEFLDFTVTAGTLTMTVTNSQFLNAYKEFVAGDLSPLASVGLHGIDVTVQGSSNATVTIGDRNNAALGNTFLNGRLASVRVANDAGATGNIDVTMGRNIFRSNDHSSGITCTPGCSAADFDFPQAGVLIMSRGADTATFDVIVDNNLFDEVTNASGGVGQLTLDMSRGVWQVLVTNNTFDTPGNAPWFMRTELNATPAKVKFLNNTGIKGAFCSTDAAAAGGGCDLGAGQLCPGAAGYCGPGLRSLADVQNGGKLQLTIDGDDFAEHDAGFDPGQTFEGRALNVGAANTLCMNLKNNTAPDGYSLEQFDASQTVNVFTAGGSGTCTTAFPETGNCRNALNANNNKGGGGVATTTPPVVNVFNTVNVVSVACQEPVLP